jgi:hypothetical protein
MMLNNQLNSWNRLLLRKLIVAQLGKKFHILWNPEFHYRFHNSRPLVPILSQLNPVHMLSLIIVAPTHTFPDQNSENIFHFSHASYISHSSHSPSVNCPKILGEEVKVKLSLCIIKHHAMKAYWGVEV